MSAQDLEQFREAVHAYGRHEVHDADSAAYHYRLLSIINNAAMAACATCGGRGEVGGHTGQTPEQFEYVTEPCPECQGDAYGSADAPTPLGRMLGVQPAPVVDDALRKDAERYRWLRDNGRGDWDIPWDYQGEGLDQFIDSEISREKGANA